jgi:prefoldin alpha subunit
MQPVESQLEALHREVQNLRARKADIDDAIEAVETLDSGSTVQVPIGGGAYVRATVDDIDEVIVGLGGGYATERTEDVALEVLDDRKDRIDDRIEEVNEIIAELEAQGQELGQEAQQRLQQLRQEQAQGGNLPGVGTDEGG